MADPKYNGHRVEVILPSKEYAEKWKARAKASGLSMSSFIFEIIEKSEDYSPAQTSSAKDLEVIRKENRELRKDLVNAKRDAERANTELFKLKNAIYLQDRGLFPIEKRLLDALKSGGTWPERELLKELEIDPRDVDVIKLLNIQLQHFQDYGLIMETPYGWRWMK